MEIRPDQAHRHGRDAERIERPESGIANPEDRDHGANGRRMAGGKRCVAGSAMEWKKTEHVVADERGIVANPGFRPGAPECVLQLILDDHGDRQADPAQHEHGLKSRQRPAGPPAQSGGGTPTLTSPLAPSRSLPPASGGGLGWGRLRGREREGGRQAISSTRPWPQPNGRQQPSSLSRPRTAPLRWVMTGLANSRSRRSAAGSTSQAPPPMNRASAAGLCASASRPNRYASSAPCRKSALWKWDGSGDCAALPTTSMPQWAKKAATAQLRLSFHLLATASLRTPRACAAATALSAEESTGRPVRSRRLASMRCRPSGPRLSASGVPDCRIRSAPRQTRCATAPSMAATARSRSAGAKDCSLSEVEITMKSGPSSR